MLLAGISVIHWEKEGGRRGVHFFAPQYNVDSMLIYHQSSTSTKNPPLGIPRDGSYAESKCHYTFTV